ncbi:hypothetical protein M441DRAFT_426282 [Trichoderma asperellum CBS 433.97]|uniref:Uncharacterized protein n=1 Tax=Trichoderma asperellum (strain ATCC 204424 / CBS 433.97 / NBRC 101777) TaxID=1042311 RepID=A0A2T3Z5Q5_TRIA4|nr:hypothetical protein M441DRAFT_426282 [Trichoderma asperellum CBS 433.97]PTB40080.1 hypothetical protein M441DRAFT_426282 [Trichoderma asperellum CBS 433.97]
MHAYARLSCLGPITSMRATHATDPPSTAPTFFNPSLESSLFFFLPFSLVSLTCTSCSHFHCRLDVFSRNTSGNGLQ